MAFISIFLEAFWVDEDAVPANFSITDFQVRLDRFIRAPGLTSSSVLASLTFSSLPPLLFNFQMV